MAFFKFRKGGDDPSAPAAQPESVEVLRRRAKSRLIGSAILVLIGVVGFPLLVDKQPRPVAVDLPIEIPDRNKVQPLAAPVAAPVETPAAPSAPASAALTEAAPVAEKPAAKPAAPAPKPAPAVKPEPKPAKAEAKPGRTESKAASDNRYVVQVGSFADEGRARDVRSRLERAGLKNYTQAVETKDGRRIRVRVGPFASKAEAERAAEKCRKLDLPGAVLSL